VSGFILADVGWNGRLRMREVWDATEAVKMGWAGAGAGRGR
jgi:hypothetical protein